MSKTVGEIIDSVENLATLFELSPLEVVRILEFGFERWANIQNFGHLQKMKAEESFMILRNVVK